MGETIVAFFRGLREEIRRSPPLTIMINDAVWGRPEEGR